MISISQSQPRLNPEINLQPPRFVWVDAVIILLILAGTALTIPAFRSLTPDTVVIYRENRKTATYPLGKDAVITVKGARGPVELEIKNGSVTVTKAECPHGICRKTGPIRSPHAQIVCAPNHIVIMITSSEPDTLDAIVR